LLGIIFNKISKKEGGSENFKFSDSKLVFNPFPGSIRFAKNSEIDIAKKVVVI